MTMHDQPVSLDPGSEMLALSTYGNTRNLIITAMNVEGPFDEDAWALSARTAVARFPQLRSVLREHRSKWRYYLAWEPRPAEDFPVVVSCPVSPADSADLSAMIEHLSPWLEKPWDLFRRLPTEIHIIRYSENRRVIALVLHHAAADGVVAADFSKAILLEYRRLVTGAEVDASTPTEGLSTGRKRRVVVKKGGVRELIEKARLAIKPMLERSVLPAGSGNRSDTAQYHIKRLLSEEETASIVAAALQNGHSLLDQLVVSANIAVDRWNGQRNVRPGMLTTSVTVNMRGRFQGVDSPNNASLLVFKATPEQRSDPKGLARSMALARIKLFRNQMDRRYHANIAMMNDLIRTWPFSVRRRIVHFIIERFQYSLAVTLLGAIWPKVQNGRPTLESDLTELGDAKIPEVHGLGYKLLSRTRVLFYVYFFRKRMNIILAASACLFTRGEAESFLDLTLDVIRELSAPPK